VAGERSGVVSGVVESVTTEETPQPDQVSPGEDAEPEVVRAAGGIVLRAAARGGWEVAVIHRPDHRDWTLPKGKLQPHERAEDAALREVLEETGWHCGLGRFVGEVEYIDSRGRPKVVDYWLMHPLDGAWRPSREVDAMEWLPLESAIGRLSYEHDRALLASVARPAQ
jgi:8-oxo-dGTP diphosphatase